MAEGADVEPLRAAEPLERDEGLVNVRICESALALERGAAKRWSSGAFALASAGARISITSGAVRPVGTELTKAKIAPDFDRP
jgi:hypothetical protein